MTAIRLTAALALVLGVSCKSTPPTPDPLTQQVVTGELPTQWLVWTDGETGAETMLIGADGAKIATVPGIWVATEAGIWHYVNVSLPVEQSDCDCEMRAMEKGEEVGASCKQASQLEVGSLESPTGPALHVPTSEYLQSDARSVYATLDGTAGPYAFATSCIEEYTCGAAHGGTVCTQWIWDLRTAEPVDKYSMAAAPLKGESMLQFLRDTMEDEQEAAQLQSEDLEFTWVAPLYEGAFTPRMEEQYTAPTCFACSDGAWDSYTLSSRRTVDALPSALEAWFSAHAAPPGDAPSKLGGWSVMPNDPKIRAQFPHQP